MSAAPPPTAGSGLVRPFLRRLLGQSRRRLAGGASLALLAALSEGMGLMALVPLLGLLGVAGGGAGGGLARLGPLASLDGALVVFAVLALALGALGWGRSLTAARLRMGLVDQLRCDLHEALLRLDWRHANGRHSGALAQTVMMDVGRAGAAVDSLSAIAQAVAAIPILLVVAFSLSPLLAGLTCLTMIVVALASRRLDLGAVRLGLLLGQGMKRIQVALTEDLAGLRLIKASSVEARRAEFFAALVARSRRDQMEHARAGAAVSAAIKATSGAAAAIGMAVAVKGFGLGVSEALVLVMTFARLLTAGLRLHDQWRRFLHLLPGHAEAEALLAWCRQHAEPAGAAALPAWTRLRLEGVGFRHGEGGPMALAEVSLTLPAGSLTMVIGPSGAGKSTLADILLGLVGPDQGRMLADDAVIDGPARLTWRRQVGYVAQTPFLFDDTVRANLEMGGPAVDDGALWTALAAADAADLVRGLPAGLDTVVGERGARLSGGQCQRLTLARALLGQPRLLVLDEATSAVDAEAEARIMAALLALRGRMSIVAITHRAAWLEVADQVVVLERGRVAACGPWARIADAVAR